MLISRTDLKSGKNRNPERSEIIPIPISMKKRDDYSEKLSNTYSYNIPIFDPSPNSPPNDFLLKLNKRMEIYYRLDLDLAISKNSNNLVKQ